ncbi:MAG TPA: hypothetical protein VLF61_02600 [Rhabdochlamydiaceae bacterium]|nr:hypothetical protein [Rhabdochlamydiaceae bacterium]
MLANALNTIKDSLLDVVPYVPVLGDFREAKITGVMNSRIYKLVEGANTPEAQKDAIPLITKELRVLNAIRKEGLQRQHIALVLCIVGLVAGYFLAAVICIVLPSIYADTALRQIKDTSTLIDLQLENGIFNKGHILRMAHIKPSFELNPSHT